MSWQRERGIRRITPGGQLSAEGINHNISPQCSEWLPELLEKIASESIRGVRKLIAQYRPTALESQRLGTFVHDVLLDEIFDLGHESWSETHHIWSDEDAEVAQYAQSLTDLALLYEETNNWDDFPAGLTDDVTKIGTGKGPLNGDLSALAKGPARLHQNINNGDKPVVITLSFDAEAWTDLQDRRTGVRSLAALAILASAFDVRLILSPQLDSHIERRYWHWYRAHLSLTETPDQSHDIATDKADHEQAPTIQKAWEALTELPEQTKKSRILLHLNENPREFRSLARDDELDLAAGSIEPYVNELAGLDLVEKHTNRQYNAVSLSPLGTIAVDELITSDGSFVHPLQSRLETRLTPTPQADASTVCRTQSSTSSPHTHSSSGEFQSRSAEEHVADTGTPENDASYVQWLDGPTDRLDSYSMYKRYMAGRRSPGVNLVDDSVHRFNDGRISYISCFDDDLLVLTQWGGVIPTLGRIAGALLSNRALSKILTIDALGDEFENIDDSIVEKLDREVGDILRWGHQIGWLSDKDLTYDDWKNRFVAVKSLLLQQVGELAGSDDTDARTELIKDLLGLITSVTHLYYSIGVDVTVNIRMPDMETLLDREHRLDDFLNFLKYVVPKQTIYGYHSGYRTIIEDRASKLKKRLPYEVDPSDPTTNLTASWILSGPSMTELKEEIEAAIGSENPRESIQNKEETAPSMEIPVQVADSYAAIKQIVRCEFRQKQYLVSEEDDLSPESKHDLNRLTRLFLRVFSTADKPHRCCPHDVMEAILYVAKSTKSYDFVRVRDLEYGISQVPADRVLPGVKVTVTKMLQTALEADGPLGRSEIIERSGVSESTYDRHIDELAMMDVFEPQYRNGHRCWNAVLEPWWVPQTDRDDPPGVIADDDDLKWLVPTPRTEDILRQISLRFAKTFGNTDLRNAWRDIPRPQDNLERFLGASERFSGWWPFIWGAVVTDERLHTGPSATVENEVKIAQIGYRPEHCDDEQTRLTNSDSSSTVGSVASAD